MSVKHTRKKMKTNGEDHFNTPRCTSMSLYTWSPPSYTTSTTNVLKKKIKTYPGGHRPTQKQAMEQVVGLCVRQGRVGRVQQPTGARQVAVPAMNINHIEKRSVLVLLVLAFTHCIHTSNKHKHKTCARIHSTFTMIRACLFIMLSVLEITQRCTTNMYNTDFTYNHASTVVTTRCCWARDNTHVPAT